MASQLIAQPVVQAQIKENIKAPKLCEGNPPVTSGFPAQKDSNIENVSISWHCHSKWWHFAQTSMYYFFKLSQFPTTGDGLTMPP